MEQKIAQHIEAEIAELEERIAEKRRNLETENKIISDKDLVSEAITDFSATPRVVPPVAEGSESSYLETLPEEVEQTVAYLVDRVFTKGLAKTIAEAKKLSFLDEDAFHDTLTDKVHAELKKRGLVN
ncbi:MAG: hypothetical protein A2571_00655 [Candidatus Vogelbacteria bacterium RIFOXYD1_FULL_44_32]|uniref:Uncharacterized protein n=1 Tax=Candidatus Vogelbacteria bacterium RIFOXYD1_FULL_44_32 TaxID=1802438 RepID=A0A1G2QEM8_9BACT|nr:MAG: hypothetical protein A2571_00655 [Candidatus Vogelbacteria bacterium RIFOXYD1_FULL_44_32]